MDKTLLKGAKVLHNAPKYLAGVKVKGDTKVVEMGTLTNYKKFMTMHQDFTKSAHLDSMCTSGTSFSGTRNYNTFLKLIDEGDKDVMEKVKVATRTKVKELAKKYEEVIHNYKFDVTGQFFDVGLVLTGVPETWLEPIIDQEEKVQVDIIINGAFSASVSKDDIINGASRILAITKILEDNGVQVGIKIVSSIRNYSSEHGELYVSTDVKAHDEPINYRKVSALLSPTYLRRGMFKVMEMVGGDTLSSGYGYAIEPKGFINLQRKSELDALEARLFQKEK